MAKKSSSKKNERTVTIKLLHRKIDLIIGNFGKRFQRIADLEKLSEKARFGKLGLIRSLITDEKMRILRQIKEKSPKSIYSLAKSLKRDLKSVRKDIKYLSDIGFIKLTPVKSNDKLPRLQPTLAIDKFNIVIELV